MHPAALQWREGSKITRLLGVIPQRTLCEKLRRVRDVSRLGAHGGQASAVCSNRSENKGCLRVGSMGQLGGKSSNRVQTGEPVLRWAVFRSVHRFARLRHHSLALDVTASAASS